MKRKLYIGHDYAVADILDEVSEIFRQKGFEVERGKPHQPPALIEYGHNELPPIFGDVEVILASVRTKMPRELLDAAPKLRGLVFPTIGTDSLELKDAAELGLIVGNGATPENFLGMAESTAMLIAALFLDLPGKMRMFETNAPRPRIGDMKAKMVRGRTIGMIGLGRIARAAIDRLQGWGANFQAYDPYVTQDKAPPGVKMVDMDTLLRTSDLVSIHVTLTSETKHMIGREELEKMKPGAYLVNTARGGAVDDDALYEALSTGRIGGAGLDVFGQEPLPLDNPLRKLDNVILTTHIVGHTSDLKESFVNAAVENITRVLNGEPPVYVRNPEVMDAWKARLARLDAQTTPA